MTNEGMLFVKHWGDRMGVHHASCTSCHTDCEHPLLTVIDKNENSYRSLDWLQMTAAPLVLIVVATAEMERLASSPLCLS